MSTTTTNDYFGKAQALASVAESELELARAVDDNIKARQAAGKGWLAMREYLAEARALANREGSHAQ